jgi:hypothetical protein
MFFTAEHHVQLDYFFCQLSFCFISDKLMQKITQEGAINERIYAVYDNVYAV